MRRFVPLNNHNVDEIIDILTKINSIELTYYILYKQLPLVGNLSVLENIALNLSYHKKLRIRDITESVKKELSRFNLQDKLHHRRDSLTDFDILIVKYIAAKLYGVKEIVFIMPLDHAGVGLSGDLIRFFKNCDENYTILDYNETYHEYEGIDNLLKLEMNEWLTQDLKE